MAIKKVFGRPQALRDVATIFCPGCTHGIAHNLVAESIDHFGLREQTIGVASVGCSVLLYDYFDVDVMESPHGRALAVATGVKRASPDKFVFTYQGDGDLASIGLCETIHAANRGEKLSVFFINNAVYGMTGGQSAPTTLIGQKTTTAPEGRRFETHGSPLKMAEMLGALDGVAYCERVALFDAKHVLRARKAVFRAFETQLEGKGFAFIEMLSACPTNLRMTPVNAQHWVAEEMVKVFPLGVFKEPDTGKPVKAAALQGSALCCSRS